MSLAALLAEHPFGDAEPLLHTIDRSMTAGAARAAATDMARRLRAAGVEAGQPVAVRLPDAPELVTVLFGVWEAGAVFVPVNARSPASEVDRIVAATRPAALVSEDGIATFDGAARHEPDAAFVLWTSGTTGVPRPILHTHSAYVELLDRVLVPLRGTAAGRGRRPSPNLIPVSMALNAGLYNVLFGLRAGAPLVIMDRFDTRVFAELVRRFEIRSTVLPPAAIATLNDDPSVDDLGPLRYVRSITAPLSPLQARRFTDRFGAWVLNGYGQAEMGEVIGWTAADAKSHPEKIGAVGRPHPGVAVKIVGTDGTEVATDEVGRLLVRPPRMATGTAGGDDELAGRLDAQGFLDTGDLGRVDADGFVWIEGRAGDVVNRGGNKVFPEHVEEVLRLVPGVRDAAVVGAPDDRLGEVPVAYVVAGPEVTDADLDTVCREHLVAYKVPVEFRRVDELPRSEVGKLLRAKLRDR